jgi:hypothetical protein
MSARLKVIRQRRDALVARAEAQRQTLGHLTRRWRTTLSVANTGLALAREVRAHWVTVAAGTTLLTWMGRGRLGVWIGRIWMAWAMYRSVSNQASRPLP